MVKLRFDHMNKCSDLWILPNDANLKEVSYES